MLRHQRRRIANAVLELCRVPLCGDNHEFGCLGRAPVGSGIRCAQAVLRRRSPREADKKTNEADSPNLMGFRARDRSIVVVRWARLKYS